MVSQLQGTRFGLATIDNVLHLAASHGDIVILVPLVVRGIAVENMLQAEGPAAEAVPQTPRVNRLLNYFHSTCERFPLDDSLSSLALTADNKHCERVVTLHLCCGATRPGGPDSDK